MPTLNHILIKQSAGLFGRIVFGLIFLFGCTDTIEAKSLSFADNENPSLAVDPKIEEDVAVISGTIYIVEGTITHNVENKKNAHIVYVKSNGNLKQETAKHKKFVEHKKAKPDLKEKVQQKEELRKEFQFLGTNKVPVALYEIGNGIKSIMPTSVSSFKVALSKIYAAPQSISFLSDDVADIKEQFSFYLLADKTRFYLTAMAVRPPPYLLG